MTSSDSTSDSDWLNNFPSNTNVALKLSPKAAFSSIPNKFNIDLLTNTLFLALLWKGIITFSIRLTVSIWEIISTKSKSSSSLNSVNKLSISAFPLTSIWLSVAELLALRAPDMEAVLFAVSSSPATTLSPKTFPLVNLAGKLINSTSSALIKALIVFCCWSSFLSVK